MFCYDAAPEKCTSPVASGLAASGHSETETHMAAGGDAAGGDDIKLETLLMCSASAQQFQSVITTNT
eukprot:2877002-Karenia_brevis.AAC.1